MKIIQFKESVRIKRLTPVLVEILRILDGLQNKVDWIPQLTITSINDSTHKEGSHHYKDEALDIRTHNFFSPEDKVRFRFLLQDELGDKFTVLLESLKLPNEHIHVQLRNGETYP